MTVSIATHCNRFRRGIRLCSVTPDEYRSSVLIAKSWTIAKIRYGQMNQLGNPEIKPLTVVALGTPVATAAPRISSSADGIAPPSATASTMRTLLARGGKYRE